MPTATEATYLMHVHYTTSRHNFSRKYPTTYVKYRLILKQSSSIAKRVISIFIKLMEQFSI